MKVPALFLVLALSAFAAAKPLPPPGIVVSTADKAALREGLDKLAEKLKPLANKPHVTDVEVYHKAVRYALEGGEFFKEIEVAHAKELLRTGMDRADALAKGETPWLDPRGLDTRGLQATGLVIRGYRSKIDGSVQPYGLWVPPSFSPDRPHKWRLDAWLHGRNETLSEVNFIYSTSRNAGEFTPRDTIVLFLYGRYCNANKFAGGVDLFEALADVKKDYHIDENRTLLRGFSMGGAGTWFIASHFAGEFAAAAPGAGFAETFEYAKVAEKALKDPSMQPAWWQEKTWKLTDDTVYAANFFQLPIVAYNGDQDPQRQAADIMERYMAEEGLTLSRVRGKDTGHKYTADAKVEINRKLDAIAERGRDEWPKKIRFTTYTTSYNKMRWVVVDGLRKHWERARVDAEITGEHAVTAKTVNVSAVSFELGAGAKLLDPGSKVTISIDGQTVVAPGPMTDRSWTAHLRQNGAKWELAGSTTGLAKTHGLQGPIDDAFLDSFLMVRPTGAAMNEMVGKWAKMEGDRAIGEWRKIFRGDAPVKDDSAVTDADIAANNLVLWGDPRSNKILARIADKLPVKWTAEGVWIGDRKYAAATHAPVMIYPNPLNPKKYVVINSGFTFREFANASNAWQIAELPDYAVVDLTSPPNDRWPGKIVQAGFFGEQWELLPGDGRP